MRQKLVVENSIFKTWGVMQEATFSKLGRTELPNSSSFLNGFHTQLLSLHLVISKAADSAVRVPLYPTIVYISAFIRSYDLSDTIEAGRQFRDRI